MPTLDAAFAAGALRWLIVALLVAGALWLANHALSRWMPRTWASREQSSRDV